jgi:hypothetical protein
VSLYNIKLLKSLFHKKQSIIVLLAFTLGLGMIQNGYASTNAFDEGYDDGREDYLDGYEKNSYCDPYNDDPNPDAYCASYKAGYEAGWAAASLLYGQQ